MKPIPFNRPCFAGREQEYMARAIADGRISGDGAFGRRCQEWLEKSTGAGKALLTTSGTHALEMMALLLDLKPGDEVIVPSFTFVSTANAFALRGARPVFADIRPDTFNIDEARLPGLLTERTRAVCVVHYAGVACEMDAILAAAGARGIPVLEDNAHGLLGTYRGRPLGSFGRLAAQSFHETKNLICGEGGALLINDASLVEPAEIIREKGTDRSRFFRGQVDKYTWRGLGSSYVQSDLLAAFLLAQFEHAQEIQARREAIWRRYAGALAAWAGAGGVALPAVPPHCGPSWHLFSLLLPDLAARQALIEHLAAAGILAVFHYVPLHLSAVGRELGGRPGDCPVTESVSDRLLRLPFFNDMTAEEQGRVIDAVLRFRP